MFGPLFDECIVPISIAAGLVRATVFNASRAIRATMPLYQHAYSERARCLEGVISQHKEPTTFEQFITRVYSPLPTPTTKQLKHGTLFNFYLCLNMHMLHYICVIALSMNEKKNLALSLKFNIWYIGISFNVFCQKYDN